MVNPDAMSVAASAIGFNETSQAAALRDYLSTGGQNLDPATTAWCAAFVNATLTKSGQQGTGKLNARSYLDWGQPVDQPQRGDVAVFSRGDPNGWQGHVGFLDGYNKDGTIRVLGGNQGGAVSIANYGADRLLGFRRGNALAEQPAAQPQQQAGNALAQAPLSDPMGGFRFQQNQLDPAAFRLDLNQFVRRG